MGRPENVRDALSVGKSGIVLGEYEGFTLKSAYQPIYRVSSLTTAELVGYEGLIRPCIGKQEVSPEKFLKNVAKQDKLFIESMCLALHVRNYPTSAKNGETLFLNVNVASFPRVEIMESEIFYTLSQLPKNGLNKDRVIFEIHNSAVVAPYVLMRICELFRSNGYRFALDGFGQGHSNIERYLMLRPDIIKINRSLFVDSDKLRKVEGLLSTLIKAFRENGSEVLIEELETEEEVAWATDMEVSMLQGFHLGKPQLHPVQFEREVKIAKEIELSGLKLVSG